MTVRILGLGAVGGFGCGPLDLVRDAGTPGTLVLPWGGTTREMPAWRADTTPLERFVPRRSLRRIDAFSRMAMLGACLAVEDAGEEPRAMAGLGILIASAHGPTQTTFDLIDSMIENGDACSSPIHFAGSLHNTPASQVAILLGATGPTLTLSLYEDPFSTALSLARLWLQEGRVEKVLVGMVDELSDLTGYYRARSEAPEVQGEGALFMLLETEEGKGPDYGTLEAALALPREPLATAGAMPGILAFELAAAVARSSRH